MAKTKSKSDMAQPITLETLGEFTEKVILPGVEEIVNKVVDEKLDDKLAPLHQEMKAGFSEVNKSIRVLSGEIIELKEREKEQKHEERILDLERETEIRRR